MVNRHAKKKPKIANASFRGELGRYGTGDLREEFEISRKAIRKNRHIALNVRLEAINNSSSPRNAKFTAPGKVECSNCRDHRNHSRIASFIYAIRRQSPRRRR